ncbi:hypothetical protein ACFXHD_41295, partial [Streptomyces hydrogenans]
PAPRAARAPGPVSCPGAPPATGPSAARAGRGTAGTGGRDLTGEEPARNHTAPVGQKGAEA